MIRAALILAALWAVLALTAGTAGPHPGIPGWCCGPGDCRPARVEVLSWEASRVRVNGVELVLPPHPEHGPRLHRSALGGLYCFESRSGCYDGQGRAVVSQLCARCAAQGEPAW